MAQFTRTHPSRLRLGLALLLGTAELLSAGPQCLRQRLAQGSEELSNE